MTDTPDNFAAALAVNMSTIVKHISSTLCANIVSEFVPKRRRQTMPSIDWLCLKKCYIDGVSPFAHARTDAPSC